MDTLEYFNLYWENINNLDNSSKESLINLGMGMPDPKLFKTPKIILEKLKESIKRGDYNLYCPPEGWEGIIKEIVDYENSLLDDKKYSYDNILMIPGAIFGFTLLVENLINKDNKILIFTPAYFSSISLSKLKARLEIISLESPFKINSNIINEGEVIFLCNPSNPIGTFADKQELEKIIDSSKSRNRYVIIDESDNNYIYDKNKNQIPRNITDSRVIRLKSFSKEQNLAGYRIGYMLANQEIITNLKKIIPFLYGNPTIMANRALETEFKIKNKEIKDDNYNKTIEKNEQLMKNNRNFVYKTLKKSKLVQEVILPEACYYIFVKVKYNKGSFKLFQDLLHKKSLDVCPGTLFGLSDKEP